MARDMGHDMARDMGHDMARDMGHDMARDMARPLSLSLGQLAEHAPITIAAMTHGDAVTTP